MEYYFYSLQQATAVPENFNSYRYKKMLTQGLMDISLFSANANQLRSVLEYGASFSALSVIISSLIILSLLLQVSKFDFILKTCAQTVFSSLKVV